MTVGVNDTSAILKICGGAFPGAPPPAGPLDELPDDLAQLIALWPDLPETIRTTILHLATCTVDIQE